MDDREEFFETFGRYPSSQEENFKIENGFYSDPDLKDEMEEESSGGYSHQESSHQSYQYGSSALDLNSEKIQRHVDNFKTVRNQIPTESRLVYENILAGGEVISAFFKMGESIYSCFKYFSDKKKLADKN